MRGSKAKAIRREIRKDPQAAHRWAKKRGYSEREIRRAITTSNDAHKAVAADARQTWEAKNVPGNSKAVFGQLDVDPVVTRQGGIVLVDPATADFSLPPSETP